MVSIARIVLLLSVTFGASASALADDDPSRAVSSAMGKGGYPWYDSSKDAIKPFDLTESRRRELSAPSSINWGQIIATAGFGIALVALIGLLVWFYRLYEPTEGDASTESPKAGEPTRVDTLPEGMRDEFDSGDPWLDAVRRKNQGDLAGSIVCLFAHQLLTLSRLGLVRLAPGRTGRQIVRGVTLDEFRTLVQPTLRHFEAIYYGRQVPSADEFARVWENAESFERRVAAGVTS